MNVFVPPGTFPCAAQHRTRVDTCQIRHDVEPTLKLHEAESGSYAESRVNIEFIANS